MAHDPILKGPLPGPYMEYMTRIIRYRQPSDPPETLGVETVYCKDAVAKFFNLKPAPPRTGEYADNGGNLNKGAVFAKRAEKGSNAYKILLLPFTNIDVLKRDPATGQATKTQYRRSSLGLSINGRVGVATVREWLMYWVGGASNPAHEKIKGMITPSLKTYTWRSELIENFTLPLPVNPIKFYEGDFSELPIAQVKGSGGGGSGT